MKIVNQIKTIFVALVISVASSCSDNDEPVIERLPNALEYLQKDSDSSIFVAAATKAGLLNTLRSTSIFTVFAPSNNAFTTYTSTNFPTGITEAGMAPSVTLTTAQNTELRKIMGYHLIALAKQASDFNNVFMKTYARYEASLTTPATSTNALNMFVSNSNGVKINNFANVTQGNIDISNGYIHKIDKVLRLPKVNELLSYHPDLTTFYNAAIANSSVASVFSGTTPVTIYAPVNSAFTSPYASYINTSNIFDVLRYHYELSFRNAAASNSFLATTATTDQVVNSALPSKAFTIRRNGFKIADFNSTQGNILITNVQGTNGSIHVIDYVMKSF